MGSGDEFDLDAAWVRRSQQDGRAFMEAFAARMEGAFPTHVTVERRRDSLFSSARHVRSVRIDIGQSSYLLSLEKSRFSATRMQSVRGVVLKSEETPLPTWLAALNQDIRRLADQTGAAHTVLSDFLLS